MEVGVEESEALGAVTGLIPPSDPAERRGLFNAIVNVVVADGQVTVREQAAVMSMAASFGIDPRTVSETLSAALRRSTTSRFWPAGWDRSPRRHTTGLGPPPAEPPPPATPPPPALEIGAVVGGRFRLDALQLA